MRCPKCHKDEDKVIDSRISRDGVAIRRRRECIQCGHRFTTYETIEPSDLVVIKRNGSREPFDREKLLRGLAKACEKRPVGMEELEEATDQIIAELEAEGSREIPTKLLGIKVMDRLHGIDQVAYVRYASVYRQFQDVGEFIDEINSMERRVPRSVMHPELFN
ncbi:MAG TPA: transcriptional regulator NrdR [Verrucomicrobiales bacterium]|jgi:transcriptional repressor NrdR|nr:transcriptional regulator NrdR [Verrucomicrobiales bacterium]